MALPEPSDPLQPEEIEHRAGSVTTAARICIWFGCLLVVLVIFSLVLGRAIGGGFLFIFRITAMLAVPVGCLYLRPVVKYQDAEQRRWLVLIAVGTLIGPVALAGLGIVASLFGDHPYLVWVGDGEDPGFIGLAPYALIVGSLTSVIYVIALKVARRLRLSA